MAWTALDIIQTVGPLVTSAVGAVIGYVIGFKRLETDIASVKDQLRAEVKDMKESIDSLKIKVENERLDNAREHGDVKAAIAGLRATIDAMQDNS